jgi:hypothetical protein
MRDVSEFYKIRKESSVYRNEGCLDIYWKAYFSSATLLSSRGLAKNRDFADIRTAIESAYCFKRPSTEDRTTGKVVAMCFLDDTKPRTVFSACARIYNKAALRGVFLCLSLTL